MKHKYLLSVLALSISLSLAPAAVYAEATTAVEATADAETENAETEEEEIEIKDIEVEVDSEAYIIKNDTKIPEFKAEYKPEMKEVIDEEDGTKTMVMIWNLILTEEDGTEHKLENVEIDKEKWLEPTVVEQFGFYYLTYKDEEDKLYSFFEVGEEKELEEEATVYTIVDANVREKAEPEGEPVTVAEFGSEWTVTAASPNWYKVNSGETEGYIFYEYVTTDLERLAKLREEREAAQTTAQPTPVVPQKEPVSNSGSSGNTGSSGNSGNSGSTGGTVQRPVDVPTVEGGTDIPPVLEETLTPTDTPSQPETPDTPSEEVPPVVDPVPETPDVTEPEQPTPEVPSNPDPIIDSGLDEVIIIED